MKGSIKNILLMKTKNAAKKIEKIKYEKCEIEKLKKQKMRMRKKGKGIIFNSFTVFGSSV